MLLIVAVRDGKPNPAPMAKSVIVAGHRRRMTNVTERPMTPSAPDISRSALIIVDMQNDFVHPDGGFAHRARENPEAKIDMPFLMGTVPQVRRLADAFRKAGRPVVYIAHVLKPDYSDAQFPYWRVTRGSL